MGIYTYTDSQTGKTYNFEHGGDTPTDADWAFMQQHIAADRAQLNQQSQETFGVPMLPEDDSWALGRGIDVGKTSAYGAIGTGLRDVGEATGFDWLQNFGAGMEQNARTEQLREATQLPAPTSFEDVQNDWWKLPTFLGEVAGQSIPEMGATLGATALGTLAGGPVGGFAAGTATAAPFFYGRNIQRQEQQIAAGELAGKDRMDAFLSAGGQAALNTIGDKLLLTGKLFGINVPLSRNLFVRAGQSAITGAVTEAPTEIMQQVLERAQAGMPLDNEEAIREYIEVGVAAGLLGGAVGGGTGPFRATEGQTPSPAPGTPPSVTPSAPGTPPSVTPSAPSTTPPAPGTPPSVTPSAPPTLSAVGVGLSQAELDALAGEQQAATAAQQTKALLDYLGVSANAGMRTRLAKANAAPDAQETLDELAKYSKVHSGNAKLMESKPEAPQRIAEYLATVTAPKEAPRAEPAAEPTPVSPPTEEAANVAQGIAEPIKTGRGAGIPSPTPSVGDGNVGARGGADTVGTGAPELGGLGTAGAAATAATAPTGTQPTTVTPAPAVERYNALRAAGFSDEQVRAMTPKQREAALAPAPAPEAGETDLNRRQFMRLQRLEVPKGKRPTQIAPVDDYDTYLAAENLSDDVNAAVMAEEGEVRTVPISQLRTTQSFVNPKGPRTTTPPKVADINGQLVILDGNHRVNKAIEEGKTELPVRVTSAPTLAPAAVTPKKVGPERLQKYPFANAIGGIKRGSRLAKEIEVSLGVPPGRLPTAMYAKAGEGIAETDEIVPEEMGAWQYAIPIDQTGNAFDQTAFIDALIAEANGSPVQAGRQAELAADRRIKQEADRAAGKPVTMEATPIPSIQPRYIPDRNQDISTDSERYNDVVTAVNNQLRDTGRTLSAEEYAAVNDQLFNDGGDVAEVINAVPRAPEPEAPIPGFSPELDATAPTMAPAEFDTWLDGQIGSALNTEQPPAPNRRKTANKKAGAKVSKRFAWRPAKAAVEVEGAVEDAKRRWDNELAATWEAKVAGLAPGAQEELRAFIAEPDDLADPTTAGDRKAVFDIVSVKRISPADKKLPGMTNADAAKNYFDKFPTVIEALQLMARDLGSDPKVTKLIDNKRKAQEAGTLPDWGEASSFLDVKVGPKVAEKALEWVQNNLSPVANKYLQNEVARMKRLEKAARRRVTKYAPTSQARLASEEKARAAIEETVQKGKEFAAIKRVQTINDALAGVANSEAVAEAWAANEVAKGRRQPGLAPLPEAITATRGQLEAAKKPTVPRRTGETGIDYAIRVMRPELTKEQIKALTDAELMEILADAKASRDFLGGVLYSKVPVIRQAYQMHQPLDQIAINALRNGNLESAIRYVADRIQDPQIAALALAIAKNIRGTKVAVVNPAHPDLISEEAKALTDSYGLYYPKYDTIVLNEDIGLTVSALLHEALHAVTLAELRKPDSQLRAEMQRLLDSVIDEISIYMPGKVNVEEFVAEVKTNPDLRARLAQLDAEGRNLPPQSRGKSVLEWFKALLGKFVKAINRNTSRPTALMTADSLIDMAITPERNGAADILYSKRMGAGVYAVMDSIRALGATVASSNQNSRTRLADDASTYLDVADKKSRGLLLGLLPVQFVGDIAAKRGIAKPYAMMTTIQNMNSAYDRAIERVNYMRQAYARLSKTDRRVLDALMPGSSVESVDLTLTRDNYDHWWLAYETLDANGDITGRVRRKFTSALDRDKAVAALNTNPPKNRTAARGAQDVDPEQLKAYDAMKRVFDDNTKLSQQGRDMYAAMRDFYQQEYDGLWETLKGNINASLPGDPAMAAELKKSAYLTIFGKGEITPYFPLVREGDYWLEFSIHNPITKSTEPVKKTFASPRERARFIAELRNNPNVARDMKTNEPSVHAYSSADVSSGTFADRSMFVADTMKLLARYNAKHAGTKNTISDQTIQEIAQALVEAAPEGTLAKQFHRRRNVAGYTESADLALEKKGYRLASAAARFKYGRDIRALQTEYSEASKGNSDQNNQVLAELSAIGDNALKPQNSLAERAARLANKVTYAYTLLGSPASAIVNLSGMANIIFPQLGGTYGWGATTSAMTRASKDFMGSGYHRTGELPVAIGGQTTETLRSMPSLDNYFVVDKNGKYTVNQTLGFTPEQIARAEALLPLMQELGDRGMSHKSQFYDSAGLEEMGRARSLSERAMAFFGIPFHMVERMNRQVTAIATYDLELARMEQNPTPAEALLSPAEKQAKAALEAVYQAQQLNGSASMNTAPRLTQRGVGRVMFMYKNYGITVSTVLYKSAKQLAENMYGGDKALRDQAMKQLTGHIGITFLMAGAAGLPLYGLYAMIGNALRDDDELTIEEATRLWMGELAYKGVINHVTGFEVADRVGLSGLLYRANRFNTDPTAEETLVQNVLGAPWATASRIKRGLNDVMSGEYQRGIESMVPVALTNVLQAARFASEGGVRTRQGNFMYEDPSNMELFGKLIGFNMAEYVRRQTRASEMVRVGNAVQDKRTKLMKELFIAQRTGDTAGVRRAYEKIAEFNRTVAARYPDSVITARGIEQSFERRLSGVEDMVNGVSVNPQVRPVLVQQYNAMVDGLTRY